MSFFSTTIKVPISTLENTSKELQNLVNVHEDIYDRLINVMDAMEASGEWKGTSMTAAIKTIKNNKSEVNDTINDLKELSDFLKKFVSDMKNKDTDIASKIKGIQ